MKPTVLIIFSLLFSINTFAQNNQNTTEGFTMNFMFKYQDDIRYSLSITSNEENSNFAFVNSDCAPIQRKENISDTYYFEQFKAVLQEIDIVNFKPQNNNLDLESSLRVDVSYFDNVTKQSNRFFFQHNSEIEDNENRILEFLLKVLNDNTSRTCNRDVVDKLKIYIEGEE